jgi:hypothetical protein
MVAMSGAALLPTLPVVADEGMWPFSAPPLKPLQDKYQFTPSPTWLEHLQRSSVRFVTNGASGSFVSPDGLILTNQHVGYQNAQALSDETHDYARDGFYARAPDEEKPCPGLELNVLVSTQDVTARVNAALPPGLPPERAVEARRQAIAEIEKESLEHTGPAERPKPDGQRLPEYQDANRAPLELRLFSEAPLYEAFESMRLAHSLTYLAGSLGAGSPLVESILAGKSPRDGAADLVYGSRLKEVTVRASWSASFLTATCRAS